LRERAIIHIAIPDLILQTELRKDPGLEGRALIIGDEPGEVRKGMVIALSTEALEMGLRPGMTMRKARKTAPCVTARPADYGAVEEASERFFSILGLAVPLLETLGPSEAFLSKVEGNGKWGGGGGGGPYEEAERLVLMLQARISEKTGLCTRAGIAPNKPIARLAGSRAGQDSVKVVRPNHAVAFIKTLEMEDLPAMTREAAGRLRALGVNTVDELANSPLLFLEKNLGKDTGRIIHEVSHGRGPVELIPFHQPGDMSREVVFERGPATYPLLKETLYMLTEELTSRLKAAKRTCAKVSLKITLQDFACLVSTEELEEETDSFNTTLAAALELLENTPRHTKAILIGLKLH